MLSIVFTQSHAQQLLQEPGPSTVDLLDTTHTTASNLTGPSLYATTHTSSRRWGQPEQHQETGLQSL